MLIEITHEKTPYKKKQLDVALKEFEPFVYKLGKKLSDLKMLTQSKDFNIYKQKTRIAFKKIFKNVDHNDLIIHLFQSRNASHLLISASNYLFDLFENLNKDSFEILLNDNQLHNFSLSSFNNFSLSQQEILSLLKKHVNEFENSKKPLALLLRYKEILISNQIITSNAISFFRSLLEPKIDFFIEEAFVNTNKNLADTIELLTQKEDLVQGKILDINITGQDLIFFIISKINEIKNLDSKTVLFLLKKGYFKAPYLNEDNLLGEKVWRIIWDDNHEVFIENLNLFKDLSREIIGKIIVDYHDKVSYEKLVELNESISPKFDPLLSKVKNIFGLSATYTFYKISKILESGEKIDFIEELVGSNSHNSGIKRLQEAVENFSKMILSKQFDELYYKKVIHTNDLKSSFYEDVFFKVIRYDENEFGSKNKSSMRKIINIYAQRMDRYEVNLQSYTWSDGYIEPSILANKTMENYSPSFYITFESICKQIDRIFKYLRSSKTRSQEFLNLSFIEANKNLAVFFEKRYQSKLSKQAIELAKKIQEFLKCGEISNSAIQGIMDQINTEWAKEEQEMIQIMKNEMRQFIISYYLRSEPLVILNLPNPDLSLTTGDIMRISDFIRYQIGQKFLVRNKIITEDGVGSYEKLFELTIFDNELENNKDKLDKGNDKVKILFSRGLLFEFSGEMGDVCWANKYDSIGAIFPNISSLIFINIDNKNIQRVVGASLLIEAIDHITGEKILVIRGLNPIENYINRINVESFFEQFRKYVVDIARRNGFRVAITIDRKGGASTNRRQLYNYLELMKKELEIANILDISPSDDKILPNNFNGYGIANFSYYIDY